MPLVVSKKTTPSVQNDVMGDIKQLQNRGAGFPKVRQPDQGMKIMPIGNKPVQRGVTPIEKVKQPGTGMRIMPVETIKREIGGLPGKVIGGASRAIGGVMDKMRPQPIKSPVPAPLKPIPPQKAPVMRGPQPVTRMPDKKAIARRPLPKVGGLVPFPGKQGPRKPGMPVKKKPMKPGDPMYFSNRA